MRLYIYLFPTPSPRATQGPLSRQCAGLRVISAVYMHDFPFRKTLQDVPSHFHVCGYGVLFRYEIPWDLVGHQPGVRIYCHFHGPSAPAIFSPEMTASYSMALLVVGNSK